MKTTTIPQAPPAPIAEAAICKQIVELAKRRRFCIKAISSIDRRTDAMIASQLGYGVGLVEADRKKMFSRAAAIRVSVEKGGDGHAPGDNHSVDAITAILPLILLSAQSSEAFDAHIKAVVKEMEKLAAALPIAEFQRGVRGFGEKGLAIIVGEACGESAPTIGDYRAVSGLWRRLGFSVKDGGAARDRPRQTSEMWNLGESLIKAQWAAERDEDGGKPKDTGKPAAIPAHATGPYGDVYRLRKERTFPRVEATADLPDAIGSDGRKKMHPEKWTPKRCHNDARRVMMKALVRDLWRVAHGLTPRYAAPADEGDALATA